MDREKLLTEMVEYHCSAMAIQDDERMREMIRGWFKCALAAIEEAGYVIVPSRLSLNKRRVLEAMVSASMEDLGCHDKPEQEAAPSSASLPNSQGTDGGEEVCCSWQPIETCPKHTEVLFWKSDQGISFGEFTYMAEWLTDEEREREQIDEETLFQEDAFLFTPDGFWRAERENRPTHWMPLPSEPRGQTEERSDTASPHGERLPDTKG